MTQNVVLSVNTSSAAITPVYFYQGRGCGGGDFVQVALQRCPDVLAVLLEIGGRIDAIDRLPGVIGDVGHVLLDAASRRPACRRL
jgi:hypothetical protein